ncbi:cell wall hydrolase, partial [Afipia sp. P52-10]|jgi:spore germination cell wall hydrolase CwlJ-like protein|uniref:cell wall hydrolase n=1 Tax=Afipia sp. P52-10 TaxID=1429916 RepID=UPI00055623EB
MSVLQNGPKGAWASFGFALTVFGLLPTEVGYQDIASLLARQPGVTERWQKHVIASPFGTIHAATFSFPRPIGSWIPHAPSMQLASLAANPDVTGSIARNPLGDVIRPPQASDFPVVDRSAKGDRLSSKGDRLSPASNDPTAGQAEPAANEMNAAPAAPANEPVPSPDAKASVADTSTPLDPELEAALQSAPLPQYHSTKASAVDPVLKDDAVREVVQPKDGFSVQTVHLYFGHESLGFSGGTLERWQPGEEPQLIIPNPVDTDLKQSATKPGAPAAGSDEGATVAPKGEVAAAPQRPKSPAERLGLDTKAYNKAAKCLAEAVYFEARSEPIRGQIAVAQVVVNRVFSGYYPTNVCGVVYQNKHRYLACQFTFACDGIRDVVTEPEHWVRAKKIAKEMLDGRLWLPEVNRSTHYHATYVRPYWIREMKKNYKTGLHIFYRPRQWGDGSEVPSWGSAAETAAIAAKL